MGTTKSRFADFSLTAMMLLSAIAPAYAEPAPALTDGAGTPTSAAATQSQMADSAYLVPVERSQSEINGEMVITEVFEVPATINPNTLIKDNFELSGYLYSENSIVKTPYMETKQKEVEMQFENAVNSASLADHIGELPVSMAYDVDGWQGTLYLNPQTIAINATAQSTRSSTKKQTKTYNLEMNDPTLVPESYNGLPRTNLEFTPSGFIEGSSIPSGYTATATYSRRSSYSVDSAWSMTATYSGTATYEDTNNIRYTVTYKGVEVPEDYYVMDGQLVPVGYTLEDGRIVKIEKENPIMKPLIGAGITLLVIVLIAGLVLFALWAIKKGLIYSRKITIQAQDDITGEYAVIQKVRIKTKAPAFTLDTLKAPSSRHFLCEMSGQMANKLKGKIINVTADNAAVIKHRVEPLNEKDKYTFSVDLEPVAAGPIDTFAL